MRPQMSFIWFRCRYWLSPSGDRTEKTRDNRRSTGTTEHEVENHSREVPSSQNDSIKALCDVLPQSPFSFIDWLWPRGADFVFRILPQIRIHQRRYLLGMVAVCAVLHDRLIYGELPYPDILALSSCYIVQRQFVETGTQSAAVPQRNNL